MSEQPEIKRYTVKDTWKDFEVTLEVNHRILTEERATMINQFWSDDDHRLSAEDENVVRAVVRLFGLNIINTMLAEGGACFSIDFRSPLTDESPAPYWTRDQHNEEGWGGSESNEPYGWCGIRVIAADVAPPGFDDLELAEVSYES